MGNILTLTCGRRPLRRVVRDWLYRRPWLRRLFRLRPDGQVFIQRDLLSGAESLDAIEREVFADPAAADLERYGKPPDGQWRRRFRSGGFGVGPGGAEE